MYGLEWIELLKQRRRASPATGYRPGAVVLGLGVTSLLTDVSSEMVSSLLPVYLVLHLHMSPLLFGAIDGVYNGLSVLLVALAAGVLADRARSPKPMATLGYALSAACKLLLLAAGGAWTAILLVVGLDRLGKGIRTSPRDSLISLATPREHLAAAFGVHRAMDAAGAMIGPLLAFLLLAFLPGSFELVWFVSFVFGALGVAAILLLVPARSKVEVPLPQGEPTRPAPTIASLVGDHRFRRVLCCALLLPALTLSDGFLYLLLQKASGINSAYMPLFPVGTAAAYMMAAAPTGRLADRLGRTRLIVGGYLLMALLYILLLAGFVGGVGSVVLFLVLMGMYYAATEGVLVAVGSSWLPIARRTTGIALLLTAAGIGKLFSSLLFGWLSVEIGNQSAILCVLAALAVATVVAWHLLKGAHE
jgi:MFS family permease